MATTRRRKTAPAGTIQVDFSKMKEGGGGVRLPEGDYLAKIISAKPDQSQNGNPMIVFTFEIAEGKYKGKRLVDRATLTDKALFKLRDILEALGITVPKKVVNIPIKNLVGKEIGLTAVDDEPYNGRIKSKVADYISPDNLDEEDEDDELDEDEDEVEGEDDELAEMSRVELKALIKEEELDVKVLKSMSDDDLREAVAAARDEDEDEEEGEETPPPRNRKGATKKSTAKKSKSKDDDEDEDEIEDIDLADL